MSDPLASLDHGGVEPPTDFELRRVAEEHAHGVAPGKRVLLSGCWTCRLMVRAAGVTPVPQPGAGSLTGRDIHREWRDGMLAQGRAVAPERMAWDTLDQQDRDLDDGIAARLAAPQPDAPSLRDAAQMLDTADTDLRLWDATHGYVVNSERDALAHRLSDAWLALRAALSPDPAAGQNLLDEDQGESAIDRRAREREEGTSCVQCGYPFPAKPGTIEPIDHECVP